MAYSVIHKAMVWQMRHNSLTIKSVRKQDSFQVTTHRVVTVSSGICIWPKGFAAHFYAWSFLWKLVYSWRCTDFYDVFRFCESDISSAWYLGWQMKQMRYFCAERINCKVWELWKTTVTVNSWLCGSLLYVLWQCVIYVFSIEHVSV